jgi:hypothetical protein
LILKTLHKCIENDVGDIANTTEAKSQEADSNERNGTICEDSFGFLAHEDFLMRRKGSEQ